MDFFKIKHIHDFPLDEKDHPLDPHHIPLIFQVQADFDLEDKFGISDMDYDVIDSISPYIDKQQQNSAENPEDGQYQDEWPDEENYLSGGESEDDESLQQSDMDPMGMENEDEMDPMEGEEGPSQDDENFQGIIRTVKGAALVYKRQMPDNTFTELWVMNVGNDMKKESQIKRAITAGTDIETPNGQSQDGKQNMDLYTVGNVQFISIEGLPS